MTAILVVATILIFLAVDWIIQRSRKGKTAPAGVVAWPAEKQPFPIRMPDGIFFARSHTWLSLFPSGMIRLGVDDFIANLLERAEVTLIKNEGDRVEKGEPLLVLSQNGRALTVRAPISGDILAVNEKLEGSLRLKHARLFRDGWAYTIRPGSPDQLRGLLLGSASQAWMADELRRLRDFFTAAMGNGLPAQTVLQDGGAPVPGALLRLSSEAWRRFEQQFLQAE